MGASWREKGANVHPRDRDAAWSSSILHGHCHPQLLRIHVPSFRGVSLGYVMVVWSEWGGTHAMHGHSRIAVDPCIFLAVPVEG